MLEISFQNASQHGYAVMVTFFIVNLTRALVDPQKKRIFDPITIPKKILSIRVRGDYHFLTAPGRRCLMAWTACNVRPSAAAWGRA